MKSKMHFILLLVLVVAMLQSNAQDLHFSQYFNAPILVNPANTGFNPDNDYRIGANYRNQWGAVGTPFKSMSVWGDAQLFTGKFENGWMGVGGALYRDAAGAGNLINTSAYASVAYHQMLGYSSLLSIGLQVVLLASELTLQNCHLITSGMVSFLTFRFHQTNHLHLVKLLTQICKRVSIMRISLLKNYT